MKIDYKELLIKYKSHILDYEGVDFLNPHKIKDSIVDFSEEELKVLRELELYEIE